ncbi:hypothetical protein [Bacillus gobiensis]|nr:hypothetical protein [Bacillus gobiensis]
MNGNEGALPRASSGQVRTILFSFEGSFLQMKMMFFENWITKE